MPKLTIDDEGNVLDADGNPFRVGEEVLQVTNAKTQKQVEAAVEERLARQTRRIEALKAQADKTPELQKMLDDLHGEKTELETSLKTVRENAEKEVASQIAAAAKKAEEAEFALATERKARVRDQVTNLILSKEGGIFISPSDDIVPRLLNVHKREPVKGEDGKPVDGQYLDLFEMEWDTEDGKHNRELLPVEKAIQVIASKKEMQHYIRPSNQSGAGGGYTPPVDGSLPGTRSEMTSAQKAEYTHKHGLEAFQRLPA